MSLELTISIPTAPEPEYSAQYRRGKGETVTDDTRPVLKAEAYDALDGYGIAGGDMLPGRSWSFTATKDFNVRLLYLRKGKSEYPLFVYTHPRNTGQVHIAWVLADGSERGANLGPGKTFDLRDVWADGWIIEATHGQ